MKGCVGAIEGDVRAESLVPQSTMSGFRGTVHTQAWVHAGSAVHWLFNKAIERRAERHGSRSSWRVMGIFCNDAASCYEAADGVVKFPESRREVVALFYGLRSIHIFLCIVHVSLD